MSLRTPMSNDGNFEPAPAGWQIARCFAVIDLGTHFDEKWDKETHLVRIGFELPKTKRNDGKPFSIYKRYTLSHHEKSRLRQDLEAWYGKKFSTAALNKAGGFDLEKLIDREAFINITHTESDNGNVFANISAIGPLPAEMECPPPVNAPVLFSLQTFDEQVFNSLTEKTQEQIKESGEYRVMTGTLKAPPGYKGPGSEIPADGWREEEVEDIPF